MRAGSNFFHSPSLGPYTGFSRSAFAGRVTRQEAFYQAASRPFRLLRVFRLACSERSQVRNSGSRRHQEWLSPLLCRSGSKKWTGAEDLQEHGRRLQELQVYSSTRGNYFRTQLDQVEEHVQAMCQAGDRVSISPGRLTSTGSPSRIGSSAGDPLSRGR